MNQDQWLEMLKTNDVDFQAELARFLAANNITAEAHKQGLRGRYVVCYAKPPTEHIDHLALERVGDRRGTRYETKEDWGE